MGTSSSNPGQSNNTPLVPSWLDDDNNQNISEPMKDENEQPIEPKRFSTPRNNFTRFVKSGGDKKYLKSASRAYVNTSLGGSNNATKRLGSALRSTGNLIGLLGDLNKNGISKTLRDQGLNSLVGMPLSDVFIGLVDYISPNGGRVDEGIARDALDEAIIDFAESMNDEVDIDKVSSHQLEALIETYIVNVIQKRLINDIGNNLIELSGSVEEVNKIQEQISDFIQGAVSDSINNVEGGALLDIDSENVSDVVKQIYTEAYDILGSIGED